MRRHRTGMFIAMCAVAGGQVARAAEPPADASDPDSELTAVVVTATRMAHDTLTLPMSVDRIGAAEIHDGQSQVNLSESLETVPGVSVQSRQNYAQDLQISSRGFGARSAFGVRGVRLYSDGIPGTMPDGQGQFSQFDLGSADHIEVLRGPFSALYGNSSGGVIAIFTENAKPGVLHEGTAEYGTFNTQRYALKTEGDDGIVNYVVDAAHFQTDGYRDHSNAERDNFNSKLRLSLSDDAKLTVIANVVETPFVQDPLGLTRAQLESDPRQAGVGAIQYHTRKSLDQEQLGTVLDDKLGDHDALSATVYAGHRATTQYQAIPQSTEQSALSPGGIIDLNRAYWGVDSHLTDTRDVFGSPLQLVAGMAYDDLEEARRGFLNYEGAQLGVEGALRRDEANHVYDFDQYVQAQWDPTDRWRLIAG